MKRLIALLLSIVMVLTGCGQVQPQSSTSSESTSQTETVEPTTDPIVWENVEPEYNSLDDVELLAHIEDLVYRDTVATLNSDEYFVENVSAVYISKEYLDEVAFNSQSNIYFGYTLAELDEIFQGTKYIFTLSENGTTTVQELQEIEDVSTETMLKNVAIGTGVILVCVTVSVVSAGVGAPAVSMIFAASATTAKTFAVSSVAFGGISAGVVRGIETGDFNEALEAAAMGTTEGFKWGAISGAVIGGGSEAFLLKQATKSGLTMNEAALIQANVTRDDSDIVQAIKKNAEAIWGITVYPAWQWACSDAREYRLKGVPTIQYGPSNTEGIHAPNENVDIEDVVNAGQIYVLSLCDLLGVK